jgi:hypothetical protein
VARDGVEPPTPAFSEINSDYNDFVARVALEVVDSAWWKWQLRVKSAGQRETGLAHIVGAALGSRYSDARVLLSIWFWGALTSVKTPHLRRFCIFPVLSEHSFGNLAAGCH